MGLTDHTVGCISSVSACPAAEPSAITVQSQAPTADIPELSRQLLSSSWHCGCGHLASGRDQQMIWQDFVQNQGLQDYPKLAILAWGV